MSEPANYFTPRVSRGGLELYRGGEDVIRQESVTHSVRESRQPTGHPAHPVVDEQPSRVYGSRRLLDGAVNTLVLIGMILGVILAITVVILAARVWGWLL